MGRLGGHKSVPRHLALGLLFAALALLVLLVPDARAGPLGDDFGDAPDGAPARYISAPAVTGRFPSKAASGGPRHTLLDSLFLGADESPETDSAQVDKDLFDDGTSAKLTACGASTMKVLLNAKGLPASKLTAADTIYVNVWMDWNRDGDWSDGFDGCAREWAVENVPVSGGRLAGTKLLVLPISLKAGKQADELWYRVTISLNHPASNPTGGAGPVAYDEGETEDVLVQNLGTRHPTFKIKKPKKPPKNPKKPKFKVTCVPNPLVIAHGATAKIRLRIVKGKGEIRGAFEGGRRGPGYTVKPNPLKPQPNGFPKNGRFVADSLTIKHTAVDPPTRVQVVVIKLRFQQGKQVQRLKCVVIVIHVAAQLVPRVFPPPFICGTACAGAARPQPDVGTALSARWRRKTVTPPGGTVPIEIVSLSLQSVQPLPAPVDGLRIPLEQFAPPWGARLIQSNQAGASCDVAARQGGKPSLDCRFPRKPAGTTGIDLFFDILYELPPPPPAGFGLNTASYEYDAQGRIVKVTDLNSHVAVYTSACNDDVDNDGDLKTDGGDPGCASAQDESEGPPNFTGSGGGQFSSGGGGILQWQVGFDQPTSGFKIVVPGSRQISNASVQGTGFTCSVTTTATANDSYSCSKALGPGVPAQGQFTVNPVPNSGMGGQLFGAQGTAQSGALSITGPS